MLYEDKEKRISVVYSDKEIMLYTIIIPDQLVKDIRVSKENILKNHTTAAKKIKIRKLPDDKRIKKEVNTLYKGLKCS